MEPFGVRKRKQARRVQWALDTALPCTKTPALDLLQRRLGHLNLRGPWLHLVQDLHVRVPNGVDLQSPSSCTDSSMSKRTRKNDSFLKKLKALPSSQTSLRLWKFGPSRIGASSPLHWTGAKVKHHIWAYGEEQHGELRAASKGWWRAGHQWYHNLRSRQHKLPNPSKKNGTRTWGPGCFLLRFS